MQTEFKHHFSAILQQETPEMAAFHAAEASVCVCVCMCMYVHIYIHI